jgi:hypothetical protein
VRLAELVSSVLGQVRSENVDPAGPTVTNEGPDVEIVIVPHRDLGGISLVAWLDKRSARLLWANVVDLSTHDDLDLGVVVERIALEADWRGRLRGAIAAELDRPIELRTRRGLFGARIECWIVAAGKEKRIGVLRPRTVRVGPEPDTTTSLAGGPRPRLSFPPQISQAGRLDR